MADPIRIANCSGFFGDRPSGALEMVEGGPIDVLTGDWLAELTMLILSRIRAKRAGSGYARTFVAQMEQVMGTCLDNGIKVVSNAGGLDPDGCAEAVAEVADRLGLAPTIAYVNGDDLMPSLSELMADGSLQPFGTHPSDLASADFDPGRFVTANAYLGCWGIVEALNKGADIVITGRVTDAAVTCGPAAWHHQWSRTDFDQLAGAVVAGHIIECSAQATGGNYSFFHEIDQSLPRFGFPWAEVSADGSSVIGKHDGTGGVVNVETVTSQVLYEIGGRDYFGPDVTARFDTIELEQIGRDRVQVSGVRGEAPPATLKVAMNEFGGFRNSFTVALTGLDLEEKAQFAAAAFWDACPFAAEDFDSAVSRVIPTSKPDPQTQEEATAIWRLTVKDRDDKKVGRAFADALVHTALAGIPGMYSLGGGPSGAKPFGVYHPARIPASLVPSQVHMFSRDDPDRMTVVESDLPVTIEPASEIVGSLHMAIEVPGPMPGGPTTLAPLGTVVGARSGDKGGNANVGLYARTEQGWRWLDHALTVEMLRELLPEASDLTIERHRFPRIWSLNFVIHDLLEEGVAASTRQDAQAKAVGEWLRSRVVELPTALLV